MDPDVPVARSDESPVDIALEADFRDDGRDRQSHRVAGLPEGIGVMDGGIPRDRHIGLLSATHSFAVRTIRAPRNASTSMARSAKVLGGPRHRGYRLRSAKTGTRSSPPRRRDRGAAVGGPEIARHSIYRDAVLQDLDPAVARGAHRPLPPHSTWTPVVPLPEATVRRVGWLPRLAKPGVRQFCSPGRAWAAGCWDRDFGGTLNERAHGGRKTVSSPQTPARRASNDSAHFFDGAQA